MAVGLAVGQTRGKRPAPAGTQAGADKMGWEGFPPRKGHFSSIRCPHDQWKFPLAQQILLTR